MPSTIPSICDYLSFPKFWPISFHSKFYVWGKKIDRQRLTGYVTSTADGLKKNIRIKF